jgi:histidyl-tRNA synthetase
MFRAERPQRGRLREHIQWNVDLIGDAEATAEGEVIATAVGVLEGLGLTSDDVRVKISHRGAIEAALASYGVPEDRMLEAFALVDAVEKLDADEFRSRAEALGVDPSRWDGFLAYLARDDHAAGSAPDDMPQLAAVHRELETLGLLDWCSYRPSLARGLAYYTGTVFEIHETTGRERAIAGGGRYDELVGLFGGPPTPAVGVAMGDVVIRLVLEDHDLIEPPERYQPAPDVFVINARKDDDSPTTLRRIVAELRRSGLHVRHSDRTTRNLGKLLGEAGNTRARYAVILAAELDEGNVVIKDLQSGDQEEADPSALSDVLHRRLATPHGA